MITGKLFVKILLSLAMVSPERHMRDSDCHCFKIFVIIPADESICC